MEGEDRPETQEKRSRASKRPVVVLGAVLVTTFAALFAVALAAEGLTIAIIVLVGVLSLGGYLLWTAADRDAAWGDVGRGLIIGGLLAVATGFVQIQLDEQVRTRNERLTIGLQPQLVGSDLSGHDLSDLQLAKKNFSEADLRNADLHDANLSGATLQQANLAGADLSGANLEQADLTGARLSDANLAGANLSLSEVVAARLARADLADAALIGANLRDACLADASLARAKLAGADLAGAVLTAADLRAAIFEEDLRGAQVDGAGLARARFDSATVWPEGFDPRTPEPESQVVAPANRPAATGRREPPGAARVDRVERLVDGDTLVLEKVGPTRLIGVDAPGSRELLGEEATRLARSQLAPGQPVRYLFDRRRRDEFGRALVYLWSGDRFFNETLLSHGLATALASPPNLRHKGRFRRVERQAKGAGIGLWKGCPG